MTPPIAWTARGLAGVALLSAFTVGLSGSLGADSPTVRTGLLAQARAGHTATLMPDGRVLFTGGRSREDALLATTERWDPATRTSTVLAGQLTTPRVQHAAALLPTAEVLLTAGRDAAGVLRQAELFRPPGPGQALPDALQIARAGHTSTLLFDGRVLLLGGRDVSQVGLAEGEVFEVDMGLLYDPQHGQFTLLPHLLQVPRHNHTATQLPDGRILVVGGKQGEAFLGSLEVVDPVEGTSTLLAAQLHRARARHGAVLLNDGRVVVAGGRHEEQVLDTAEVIDPSTGTVTQLDARLRRPRVEFTATTLATGEILLAGGRTVDDDPRRDWELYGPPPADPTPLTVLAVSPADQATGVTRTPLLALRFSEPIKVTTFTPTQVRLTDASGQTLPGTVTPAEEGLLGFVLPSAPLAPGTTYTLTLQGVTDRAGNPLAPVTSRFATVGASPAITGFSPGSGAVGATVFLTGENFDSVAANNQVKFNGVAAIVTSATVTSLTTLVPPGASTGPITVTTPGGTGTSASNFIVITGPTITGLSPAQGPVGTAVMITGQNFDPVAVNNQLAFNGKPAIITSASPSSMTTTVPQGATTGAITVTTPQGTASSSLFTVTRTQDFALNALPTPLTLPASGQGAFAVSLTGTGGFTNLARLTLTGLPAGTSAAFSAATLTAGQSALLTLVTNGTTAAGTSPLTITATGLLDAVETSRTATVSVQVQGGGETSLMGQVLDEEAKPVKGAVVKLGALQATTDDGGNFFLQNPPAGADQLLFIDGGPASQPGRNYPIIPYKVTIVAGQANTLGFTPHLHFQKTTGLVDISSSSVERIVTDPELPGYQMTIPAGVTITGWDGQPNTKLSVRRVAIDRSPLPALPGDRYAPALYMDYFDKPGGGTPSAPVPITFPNDLDVPPGTQVELWYFDEAPDGSRPNQWAQYGTGTVSADGSQIVPDVDPATGKAFGQPRFCCGGVAAAIARLLREAIERLRGGIALLLEGLKGGEPVDLATGVFVLEKTDLVLPGRLPVVFTRTYRTNGPAGGPFGPGTGHTFHVLLLIENNLRTLLLPNGARIALPRQADGTFRTNTDPAFRGAVLTESGVPTLRLRDGTVWSFGLQILDTAFLTQQRDRHGNTLTLTRSGSVGNLTRITDASGRQLQVSYDASNRITELSDPLGRVVHYTYDAGGRLSAVTDPQGGTTRYTYDAAGRMVTLTDAREITFLTNEYDSAGRVTRQTQADGGIWQFAYTTTNGVITQTVVTDPRGQRTTHRFSGRGYPLEQTDDLGQTTTSTRDSASNLLLATTDAQGRKTRFSYDAAGNVTAITDPDNRVTRFEYEPTFNRVTKITDALNQVTTFEYDAQGNLIKTIDPLTHTTTIAYNSFGQPTAVTDPIGNTTTFTYDVGGNLETTTDPLGNRTQRAYDGVSRLMALTDPRGLVTSFGYDPLNRVTEITDPRNGVTRFSYDPNGNLLSVSDAKNQTTTYTYDTMDRLATRTDALNRQEGYQYDAAGNLTLFTDRKNQQSTFQYDALNRRTNVQYADASTTSFTYDSVGRLSVAEDSSSGRIEFTYDTLDRLIKELTPQGVVNYGYDALGRRTTMTANGQAPVGYQYDAASRLTQVAQGSQVVGLGYDAAGRRTSLTYPNATNTSYTYDNASRLTSIVHNGPSGLIEALSYAYDAAGNRISLTRTNGTASLLPQAVQAAYDAANEQIQFNSASPNHTFDANGNLTNQTDAGVTTTYTWDARNRLTEISGPGLNANFSYDALGRRISKSITGVTTQFLYDGNDIVQEIGGGAVGASYVRSLNIDEPFVRQGTTSDFYHTDALGSTLTLSNTAGATAVSYSYETFGRAAVTGTSSNPFQYTGRESDGTGLYYYRARYYSPFLQRFVTEDPLDFEGGDINLYAYAQGDPVSLNDPDGELAGCIVAAALSGALIDAGVQLYGNIVLGNRKDLFEGVLTAALVGAGKGALFGATCGIAPALNALRAARAGKEVVQRAMSRAELAATEATGLLRGGRQGTHYVSDAVNSSANRARQRLSLPQNPEVRVSVEVPRGPFSPPARVPSKGGLPGGGTERTATGDVPVRIIRVDPF